MSPFAAGNEHVTDPERAALHQDGRHVAPAPLDFGLDHHPVGRPVRVGLELEDLRLQQDDLFQLVEIGSLLGRNLDGENLAAHGFEHDLVLQQLLAHLVGIGAGLVDLVDGDDDRHLGGLGVVDRLDGLGLDPVIGGDNQNDDVRHLGAARAHGRERLVARRVEEGNLAAGAELHPVGADMLGDAAGLVAGDIGLAQRVEKRRLAVIDVAHDGDHRRPGLEALLGVGRALEADLDIGFADTFDVMAEFGDQKLRRVAVYGLVDRRHHVHLHQCLDHLGAALGHAVRQFLDGNRFRDHDVAHDLDQFHRGRGLLGASFPLALAAHRGQAADPLMGVIVERPRDRQLTAAAAFNVPAQRQAGPPCLGPPAPLGPFLRDFFRGGFLYRLGRHRGRFQFLGGRRGRRRLSGDLLCLFLDFLRFPGLGRGRLPDHRLGDNIGDFCAESFLREHYSFLFRFLANLLAGADRPLERPRPRRLFLLGQGPKLGLPGGFRRARGCHRPRLSRRVRRRRDLQPRLDLGHAAAGTGCISPLLLDLDSHRLGAAMGEALANLTGFDRLFQLQTAGPRQRQRLLPLLFVRRVRHPKPSL